MIIELFGPPGVGKTTFASALAAFLRAHGQMVDPVMSYRPAEQAPACTSPAIKYGQGGALVRRLARPVAELMATTSHLLWHSDDIGTTAELMRLLPPKSLIWSVRLRQYLVRLSHSWNIASVSPNVVLFDQAFVQAVCSLALLARLPAGSRIGHALDTVPAADLLIQLDAPRDILVTRLGGRQQRQSKVEQLLELDLQTNLASMEIIDDLRLLLRARGRSITLLECADQPTLHAGVARVGADILARLAAGGAARAVRDRQISERPQHA